MPGINFTEERDGIKKGGRIGKEMRVQGQY